MKRLWLICLVMLAFCVCGCGSKEVTQKEEKLFLAEYEIGPRSGRPMYKGDYEYDPNEGFTLYQKKRVQLK